MGERGAWAHLGVEAMATKYLVRQVRFPVLGRPLSGKETAAQGTVRKREEKKKEEENRKIPRERSRV